MQRRDSALFGVFDGHGGEQVPAARDLGFHAIGGACQVARFVVRQPYLRRPHLCHCDMELANWAHSRLTLAGSVFSQNSRNMYMYIPLGNKVMPRRRLPQVLADIPGRDAETALREVFVCPLVSVLMELDVQAYLRLDDMLRQPAIAAELRDMTLPGS